MHTHRSRGFNLYLVNVFMIPCRLFGIEIDNPSYAIMQVHKLCQINLLKSIVLKLTILKINSQFFKNKRGAPLLIFLLLMANGEL
jgi:hypothetical protein